MMSYQPENNILFKVNTKFLVFVLSLLCLSFSAHSEKRKFTFKSEGMKLVLEKVAGGFNTPWGLTFISPNKLLITEREGDVFFLDINKLTKTKINNSPPVLSEGQGGMLDVALSPDYKKSGWIYFTFVKEIDGEGATVLARAKIKQNKFYHWQELLVTESTSDTGRHFGSRIAFDEQGHVYFGVGDRGERPNSQDLSNHAGSIIRLNLDGSVPKDNPFVNSETALPEIWSYGHRNPQGLVYDHHTKRLWEIEHGPRGGDEINLIKPGKNYGWPVISYGKEYWGPLAVGEGTHRKGMEQPVKVFTPSIAPGSLLLYSGDAFPHWKGNLFSGALKLRHLNRVVINDKVKAIKEERLLESLDERIRALAQSSEGWIYFSADSGNIYRLKPAAGVR